MYKYSDQDKFLIPSDFGNGLLSSNATSKNSFLVEIEHNDDISGSLRKEINSRYNRSKTNKTYKFPRINQSTTIKITKNSLRDSLLKNRKPLNESNKIRSLSPYDMSMNKTFKSKSPHRSDLLASSKTPLPMNITAKVKTSFNLPKFNKASIESQRISQVWKYSKRKIFRKIE